MYDPLLVPSAEKEILMSLMGRSGGQVGQWIQGADFS